MSNPKPCPPDPRYKRIGMAVWDLAEVRILATVTDESGRTGNMIADALNRADVEDALRAEAARLREALERYGSHESGCNTEHWYCDDDGDKSVEPCTCGLAAAKEAKG